MIRRVECRVCFFFTCRYSTRVFQIHAEMSYNLLLSSGALSIWSFPFVVRTDCSFSLGPSLGILGVPLFSVHGESLSPENLGTPRRPKVKGEGCDGRDNFHHDRIIFLLTPISSFFVENVNPVIDQFVGHG